MARIYGEIQSSALMTFDKSFSRSNGQPLDSTEIFYSLIAAQDYAKTDVAYVGQKIVVVETKDDVTTVTHYGIEADNSLKELGAIPVGDGVTVEVVDGKIQLAALEGHTSGTYQPFLVDGKIEWREPSATTVEGLDSRLTTAEEDIESIEVIVGKEASEGVEATGLVKAVADNADAIEAEADARKDADKANSDAIDAINTKIGEVAEGKTIVEMISDAQSEATYDDTDLVARVEAAEADIDALESKAHEHANKAELDKIVEGDKAKWDAMEQNAKDYANGLNTSMNTRVEALEKAGYLDESDKEELTNAIATAKSEAIEAIMGEAGIDEKYDTLKEVADWILSDTTNSSQLITRVSTIEQDYLKGTDKTDLENEIIALSEFVGDLPEGAASETVVAYIQEVVDGLQIGDYAKASELTDLADRVSALERKSHEHANKDVIDGITAEQIAAWDEAEDNAKQAADKALNEAKAAINTAISDGDAQTLQSAKDYVDEQYEDLSGRVGSVQSTLDNKVAVEDGKSLIADTLIEKLEGISAGAQVNVIDSVDETQFAIDENKKLTLLDVAIGKVTGLQGALDGKANKGTTLAEYGITDAYTKTETEARIQEVLDGLSDTSETAASVAQALETYKTSNNQRVDTIEDKLEDIEEGAQVNKIESIKVGNTLLEIVDKSVVIPVGAGLKASDEITIAEDGALGIGEVNVNKLMQTDGEVLILNGGAAV